MLLAAVKDEKSFESLFVSKVPVCKLLHPESSSRLKELSRHSKVGFEDLVAKLCI